MTPPPMDTEFAPAERATPEELERQAGALRAFGEACALLDILPIKIAVLNRERQIIFANRSLLALLAVTDPGVLIGKRPGEAIDCVNAAAGNGCGTTEHCSTCGAVLAILESRQDGAATRECRIALASGDALDLRVHTAPAALFGGDYTVFAFEDISNEKRRRVLERIFLHDLMNTAGLLSTYGDALIDAEEGDLPELAPVINRLAKRLVDEIGSQRQLLAAENNELKVHVESFDSVAMLREIAEAMSHDRKTASTPVRVTGDSAAVTMSADRTLLRRVVANLTKNAIEASPAGAAVTLSCGVENGMIVFSVHNVGVIPRDVQMQIFQRSFSTKGDGRGLGTYSVRLLSEKYLSGKVGFTTSEEAGTVFRAAFPVIAPDAGNGSE